MIRTVLTRYTLRDVLSSRNNVVPSSSSSSVGNGRQYPNTSPLHRTFGMVAASTLNNYGSTSSSKRLLHRSFQQVQFDTTRIGTISSRIIYVDTLLQNNEDDTVSTNSTSFLETKRSYNSNVPVDSNTKTTTTTTTASTSASSSSPTASSSQQQQAMFSKVGMLGQSTSTGSTSPFVSTPGTVVPPSPLSRRQPDRSIKTYPMSHRHYQSQQQRYPTVTMNHQPHVHHSEYMIPVNAIHIAQKIDLIPVLTLGGVIGKAASRKKLYGNKHLSYCVIELDNTKNKTSTTTTTTTPASGSSATNVAETPESGNIIGNTLSEGGVSNSMSADDKITETASDMTHPGFIAIFPFGSVVFFNVSPPDVEKYIAQIKKHCHEPVFPGTERTEKYNVLVRDDTIVFDDHELESAVDAAAVSSSSSSTATASLLVEQQENIAGTTAVKQKDVTPDYCIVQKELNMNGVAVISNIMAQSVALDTYSDTVDELLTNFAKINSTVKKTGKFTSNDRHFLFKTVATNNSIFIDMISKTRIKDRSDAAWDLTKYSTIHYGMKDEFEIDDRFEGIEFKLNLIQQNAKFFMEVLHYENSNKLEWVIVVLIAVECVLMMTEMSGNGARVFGYLNSLLSSSSTTTALVATTPIVDAVTDAAVSIASNIDTMTSNTDIFDTSSSSSSSENSQQ